MSDKKQHGGGDQGIPYEYTLEMEEASQGGIVEDEVDYMDDDFMYEDEILDPKERGKKQDKTVVQLPAREKKLGGKKAYKEYMDSMKNQKRNLPMDIENLPLKHKIKKIFKNDHRYYGKYVFTAPSPRLRFHPDLALTFSIP